MRYLVLILLTCCLLCKVSPAIAQQNSFPKVSGTYRSVPLKQFLLDMEKQSGYRFYFDATQFDTLVVDASFNDILLSDALDLALNKTPLSFKADNDKNIFITRGPLLQTQLPNDFFTGKAVVVKNSKDNKIPGGIPDQGGKTQAATQDNKLYIIGEESAVSGAAGVTVAGYVRDAKTGEPVIGASVYTENPRIGVFTDQYGYYSITLPKGRYTLFVKSIGMQDARRQVQVKGNGILNIETQPEVMTLKRVIVSAEKASNIKGMRMGMQKIDINTIKKVPVAFGEADILRVVTTLPGVKTVGEASTGLNVRGGSADQNLILFNDATVYNPSHFFGMFSAFNPEVVKDVELYKSSVPAKYGGRLSSVLDISSREGNKKALSGSAGIGLLTSRINLEGPLVKDKSSFIIGARTTYADWLMNLLPDQYKNSKAGFYDVNFNVTHQLDKNNTLYFSGYLSRDRFNLNSDTSYKYGNSNLSLKYKHMFSNKLNMLLVTGYDQYDYSIGSDKNPINAYQLAFDINQGNFKANFNYYLNNKHNLEFGLNSTYYKLHPGNLTPASKESLVAQDMMPAEQGLESALFLTDKYNVTDFFSLEAGLRYSMFNYLGPATVNNYPPGIPRTEDNIIGTSSYNKGEIIKTYSGPEYRLAARYILSPTFSLKASYNTQRQYIHMLSNTAAMAPTDIWKLSDPNIKPQFGDQFSFGLYKNFKSNTIETSVEVYYKNIKDYLDYKSGAVLVLNHHIETDVVNTKGKAYGVELLIKKATGKLNGWLSYTYSRILLKMDDPTAGDLINNGNYYPANYDKPNDITFVGNYRVTHRLSFSLNSTYSTGRPITLPIGKFYYAGAERTLYADRNAYRIPDYFRTDFSMNIDGNHKVHQKTHNSWSVGVYNLFGRKNPYSVYYVSENGVVNGYKLSIFGAPIPYINFNIRF